MINTYEFNYDFYQASCTIEIDTEKFTVKMAKETLTFFVWDYDKEANPIDEVAKKYAMLVIEKATQGYSLYDIRNRQFEGFFSMDGKDGIKLIECESIEFDEEKLTVKKSVGKKEKDLKE